METNDRPGTVLVVDDHILSRKNIERVVEKLFVPCACTTYEEALQALDAMTEPPVALILDVNLNSPRGDGLDIGEYAAERFQRQIPTLVITGSHLMPEITERAMRLRAEFLVKPQSSESIRLFLERVAVRTTWGACDILDLDSQMRRFAAVHHLTTRQQRLLFTLMRAAERGERPEVNENTRKSGLRRILRRTGHGNFEQLRQTVKHLAESARRAPTPAEPAASRG